MRIDTNSMPLAARLWEDGSRHLTLGGGELYREPGILGAQGIGPNGIMDSLPLHGSASGPCLDPHHR